MASHHDNPGDINSIPRFLAQHRARQGQALHDHESWLTDTFCADDHFQRHRPAGRGKTHSRCSDKSSSTDLTRLTSIFSADAPTAPPIHTPWVPVPDDPDRRELADHELRLLHDQAALAGPSALASHRMPCEFARYTGCAETFDAFSQPEAWMAHVLAGHLDWNAPAACLCWFCDVFKFEVGPAGDRGENFRARMMHIAGHFQEGTAGRVRQDFHFLDHVWDRRLISREVFEREKAVHEAPQVEGLRPRGYQTGRMVREAERGGAAVVPTGREERERRREEMGRRNERRKEGRRTRDKV